MEEELLNLLGTELDKVYFVLTDAIIGLGQDGRINRPGIETMIAVRLFVLRAGHYRRLILADLDNDGSVTRAEVVTSMGAARIEELRRIMLIDLDRDGWATLDGLSELHQIV
ncbi:hypothetical protein [Ruegeria hyattellae]|uniref:hypothetical protein n=1 Tax=Ruegeria hyattellae TaxID=3233337 RepID=UPI00355ADF04